MNERVHRYLDGELRQEALTSEERDEIAACEALVKETRESYRSIKSSGPHGPSYVAASGRSAKP